MEQYGVTLFDVAVIGVVAVSALFALWRGATREVLSLASWLGAFIAAFYLFDRAQPLGRAYIGEPLIADGVTLLLSFLVPLVAFRLATGAVAGGIAASSLSSADKMLGLAFGAVRGAALIAAIYLLVSYAVPPPEQPGWVREARLYPQVHSAAVLLERALPERARLGAASMARGAEELGRAAGDAGYSPETREALERVLPPEP